MSEERLTRAVAPELEARLGEIIPVLDHGHVRVIDYMGNDAAIVQAARVSYGAGTKSVQDDRGLIRYLMRHHHSTPFEMCEIKLHVKLPIFVARQWIRHRMANVNEVSARYSVLSREFYVPHPTQIAKQSSTNNQGRALEGIDDLRAEEVQAFLRGDAERAHDIYEVLLDEGEDGDGYGLARELARTILPLSTYTEWYWKIDLHNLFHFLRLRSDPHAQYEIRVYAEVIGRLVEAWVPEAWQAFEDYRLNAKTFSAQGMVCLQHLLAGNLVTQENSGMGKREWTEFQALLQGAA